MCACGQVWHRCPIHRIDPLMHTSRKGRKIGTKEKAKTEEAGGNDGKRRKHEAIKSSKRKAPHIGCRNEPPPARAKRRINRGRQEGTINHEVRVTNQSPPNAEIHQRLLRRIADAEAARRQRTSEQFGKRMLKGKVKIIRGR